MSGCEEFVKLLTVGEVEWIVGPGAVELSSGPGGKHVEVAVLGEAARIQVKVQQPQSSFVVGLEDPVPVVSVVDVLQVAKGGLSRNN